MYSPQRNKMHSPLRPNKGSSPQRRFSPYRSPTKRTIDDSMKLTLEEFLASKQKKQNSSSPSKPTVQKTNPKLVNNSTNDTKKSTTSNSNLKKPSVSSNVQDIKIQVCVRKRPLNKQEIEFNEKDIAPLQNTRTISIHAPKQKVDLTNYIDEYSFTFDHVFDSQTSNRTIYNKTTLPLVKHMFQGGKATCFAYGQTGSGKTYTMLDPHHGLYFQAINDIFQHLQQPTYSNLEAWVGYYEIYQGQLLDLLNNRHRLIPREDGKGNVIISGLKEYRIHSSTVMKQVFDFGNRERSTCKTSTNENSSRSHAILQILLKRTNKVHGKLNFIDLAGSERGTDRGESDVKTRMEGAEINRSLLALKECIRALDQEKKHAPFRGSKLTMVLRDSFIGNSKTCMIATISPNHSNSDHTLNTLRYANRVKELKGESDPRLSTYSTEEDLSKENSIEDITTEIHETQHTLVQNQLNKMQLTESLSDDLDQPIPNSPHKLTKGHIQHFIQNHTSQLEACQAYIKQTTDLMNHFQWEFEELSNLNNQSAQLLLLKKYQQYQKSLLSEGQNVDYFFQKLIQRIKEELVDEDEDEDSMDLS